MHYCPESCREFLDEQPGAAASGDGAGFHYRSAPIYLLSAIVGLLLGADVLLGWLKDAGVTGLTVYQSVGGFRLALLAAVLGGARILYQTLEGILDGKVGADLALTIACLAAIIIGEHTTAALVVFIALCGESIEGYTVDRARRAIRGVFQVCPPFARVLIDDVETEIRVDEVQVGQVVVVRPGERIPIDGTVKSGETALDQSSLTGESLPVEKRAGDSVFAGSLNQFGAIEVIATSVGQDTTLNRVVELVASASERKAAMERMADRFARWFLPIVLGTALLTLIGWRLARGEWRPGFLPALSVLVVACPCPLVLATPSAVMAALAWLARAGVVCKGSRVLERLAEVDTFAFDKTGTLTAAKLELGTVLPIAELDEVDLLRTAAIAERRSEHPIARLICREAEAQGCIIPGVYDFNAFPGSGIQVSIAAEELGEWAVSSESSRSDRKPLEREPLIVGNRRLMTEAAIEIDAEVDELLAEFDARGETALLVAFNGQVLGLIGVRDTLRPEANSVLQALRGLGIQTLAMLTGDRAAAARRVANELPMCGSIEAELLPSDKAKWIEQQMAAGRRVAMVGDGINDAPALATASVGIALGGVGSDIAAEAGDLILMGDPLKPLPGLVKLSRRFVATIRQSIFLFAFGANGCGMALGATGLLSPGAAAVFHEAASLAVMINAMRLLWFDRWDVTRAGRGLMAINSGLETLISWLSPTRLIYLCLDRWKLAARLAATAGMLVWLTSGLLILSEAEQAIVTRFGRYHATLSAGMHWRWPSPLEVVRRERVAEIRTLPIGFRSAPGLTEWKETSIPPIEWTSPHGNDDVDAVSPESLTMTGDEVPIELTAEVRYRVSDLKAFVFASATPEPILRSAAESSIRQVIARASLDDVLTGARQRLEDTATGQLQRTIAAYRIGIEVVSIELLDVHPPKQVVPAYRQVADALEQQEQLINEAEAYYARKLLGVAGEAAIRDWSASVEQPRRRGDSTTGAVVPWSLTDNMWRKAVRETTDSPMPLTGEAAARLHRAQQEKARKVWQSRSSSERFLKLTEPHAKQPALVMSHLYWDAVIASLLGKPLTIVDPAVGPRQQLWMLEAPSPTTPLGPVITPNPEPTRPDESRTIPLDGKRGS